MVKAMKLRHLLAIALSTATILYASPQAPAALPEDPALLLGLNPAQVLARFGPPASVYAVRGAEPWQDDVVFEYAGGYSLFLFKDRLWQVLVAEPYAAPVFGFSVGASLDRAVAVLGSPDRDLGGAYEWALPGEAWPVRLRALPDAKGRLTKLYIYRADF